MLLTDEENQMVERIISGDRESFRYLVDHYKTYIFTIILRFVKEPGEAENIAQEVFMQIYRSLPQYRFEGLKTWIGKIAMTKAIDWHRARKRRPLESGTPFDQEDPRISQSTRDDPAEIYLRKEERERVLAVCQGLPEAYRNTVHKFYFEGKSQRQIAQEEGTTVKTIESRLYRAKHLLRERWGESR